MDRYEFNLKIDQIKKLAEKKDFKTASKIGKAMDLRKVKDWQVLALLIQVHDNAGDLEEAREVAILAYNKNLGGRRLVYKLADISVRLKDYDEAYELYKDYVKMAPKDLGRYLLLYKIKKAEHANVEELIEILEEYREHEIDEKYLCELAYLYSAVGQVENCVSVCDEIITLFRDGVYVERAIELKQQYSILSPAQEKLLEEAKLKAAREALEREEQEQLKAEEPVTPAQEEYEDESEEYDESDDYEDESEDEEAEDAYESEDSDEDEESDSEGEEESLETSDEDDEEDDDEEDDDDEVKTPDKPQSRFKAFLAKTFLVEDEDEDEEDDEDDDEEDEDEDSSEESLSEFVEEELELQEAATSVEEAAVEAVKSVDEAVTVEVKTVAENETTAAKQTVELIPGIGEDKSAEYADSSAAIAAAGDSIQQMIENAKRKLDANYEKVQREHEAEKMEEHVKNMEVPVRNYGIYDTQTLQTELVKSMNEIMSEDEAPMRPSPVAEKVPAADTVDADSDVIPEDEQIEGQLSIDDWIESVREEKYKKQQTKEFSKIELERTLEKREREQVEYEQLKAKAAMDVAASQQRERQALELVIINAVRTDLAIRTGKATARLEEDIRQFRIQQKNRMEAEQIRIQKALEEEKRKKAALRQAQLEREEAERARQMAILEQEEEDAVKAVEAALAQEVIRSEAAASEENYKEQMEAQAEPPVQEVVSVQAQEEEEQEQTVNSNATLPSAVKKYFKKYEDVQGLESILVSFYTERVLRNDENTSSSGNIMISGNRSADKTTLAMSIVKGMNVLFPENPRKIARTTGESINHKGIAKAMSKLMGTVFIIEDAGSLEKKRVEELLAILDTDTCGMLVILEDTDADLNELVFANPELKKKFNHRIVLKHFTVNEMVEMAKQYAFTQGYAIDDSALLALYLNIDKIHSKTGHFDSEEIHDIVDSAIDNAKMRNKKKLFGGAKKRKSDGANIILEIDFQ